MQPGQCFRLKSETIAIELKSDRPTAVMLPEGAIVTLESEDQKDARFVRVVWSTRVVTVFRVDLSERGFPIAPISLAK